MHVVHQSLRLCEQDRVLRRRETEEGENLMAESLQSRIQAEVGKAVNAAVSKAVNEHYKVTTTETKTVRAKKIAIGAEHLEMFPVRIEHKGTDFGREATISIDGCTRRFLVKQDENRPQYKRSWQTSLPHTPRWNVFVADKSEGQRLVESTENFEQAVQNCVVALIGHVYYDGVA